MYKAKCGYEEIATPIVAEVFCGRFGCRFCEYHTGSIIYEEGIQPRQKRKALKLVGEREENSNDIQKKAGRGRGI